MRTLLNTKGFTLIELMMAVGFAALLMSGVFAFYSAASQSYASGVTAQSLQDGANIVLSKIIEGSTESGTVYRLSTSSSYMIPNGQPGELYSCGHGAQTTACNSSAAFSELYFCQDSPCTGVNDPTARWYYLNSLGSAILYHHPVNGFWNDETVYTAPPGATLTLRFSPAAVSTPLNVVEIDVALVQTLSANITNKRLAASGAASTYVLLRNHP